MSSPATVEGDDGIGPERLRLFTALRLPEATLDEIVAWQEAELPVERRIRRDQLHVTLAFLGSRPRTDLEPVAAALRSAAARAIPPVFSTRGYRETRSVGMLVLDDEDGRAGLLASDVHERLEQLGVYERERRPWLPHVTVLRFRRPPRLRPRLPALAPFGPSDAAVYSSVLRPTGAQYHVLESVSLGG
jgi:RNA 2',3'-cyclic 3'-phosphodiesterase